MRPLDQPALLPRKPQRGTNSNPFASTVNVSRPRACRADLRKSLGRPARMQRVRAAFAFRSLSISGVEFLDGEDERPNSRLQQWRNQRRVATRTVHPLRSVLAGAAASVRSEQATVGQY